MYDILMMLVGFVEMFHYFGWFFATRIPKQKNALPPGYLLKFQKKKTKRDEYWNDMFFVDLI